jgi:hypothetical protein
MDRVGGVIVLALEGAIMRDFTGQSFSARDALSWGALGTCYLAGLGSESLIALSRLAMLAYHLLYWE